MTEKNFTQPCLDLTHIDAWIFDLDNTLYPAACNLFSQIDVRMGAYIAKYFNVDTIEARRIQKGYLHSHGTTLTGLMEVHGIEPQAFLDFVHDIDVSVIAPDPALKAAIERLPGRRLIYTNGSTSHAERVLKQLGLENVFEAIHDIVAADYCPKPRRAAYEQFVEHHGLHAPTAAMLEDMACNLEVPHAMGMTTILVPGEKPWRQANDPVEEDVDGAHIHFVAENLSSFLAMAKLMP